jgi:hypothetical protein
MRMSTVLSLPLQFAFTLVERLPRFGFESCRNRKQRALNYKTLYGRNLQIFIISLSVCPWQAVPA